MTNDPDASNHDAEHVDAAHIVVHGLCVDALVGVHDFERERRQRLRFDVEVETVAGYLDTVRSTGEYISYADIVAYIETRAASDEHVELVETWADDLASFVLAHPLASTVRITVHKLDIFERAEGVGVVLERRRADGLAG